MKNFSTFQKVIKLLILSITIIGCETHNKKVDIALMLPSIERTARFQKDKEFFLQEAEKMGCIAVVVDAENESQQMAQAQDLINQGVKAVVLAAVNSNTGAVMVRNFKNNGIATIAYDGIIRDCPLDYMISFDNKKIGTMMAEYVLTKVKEGDFIIIGGDKANLNSIEIRNGQDEILAPYIKEGKIKIAYADYAESWSSVESNLMTRRFIKLTSGQSVAAVLGGNDDIANGAIQAFEAAGMAMPVITGQDASLIACRNIVKGKQAMTVYKPIKNLAAKAANVALAASQGKKIDEVSLVIKNGNYDLPTIIIDMIAVDINNLETTVIADGFEKRELIYE